MPVKDSIDTTKESVSCIINASHTLTIYNDYSTPECTQELEALATELGFKLINLSEVVNHPSPNYQYVLQDAQKEAIRKNSHLVIIESDVFITTGTLEKLAEQVKAKTGMVAAVTHDENGEINFPYNYLNKRKTYLKHHLEDLRQQTNKQIIQAKKRLSFCCTLLSNEFLNAYDFKELDSEKNWYDVFISKKARELGFTNLIMLNNPVLHKPHSSRPWKQLKYSHPLLYYWRKLTQHKDRI